jgi:hypothetical protein
MGKYEFPCIRLREWGFKGFSHKLEVTYQSNGEYLMQVLNDQNTDLHEEIRNCLTSINWKLNAANNVCSLTFKQQADVNPLLDLALKKLTELAI